MRSDVASAWTTASRACRRARPVAVDELVRVDDAVLIGIERGAEEFARRLLGV